MLSSPTSQSTASAAAGQEAARAPDAASHVSGSSEFTSSSKAYPPRKQFLVQMSYIEIFNEVRLSMEIMVY